MRSIARALIVLLHLSGASAQQVKAQPAAASTEPRTVRFGVVVDAEGTQQEFVHSEGADPAVEVRAFFLTAKRVDQSARRRAHWCNLLRRGIVYPKQPVDRL